MITIGANQYRIARKLNAMQQFHVTRRLGPAILICGATFKMMMEGQDVPTDAWIEVAGPVMQVIGHMSDADVEYVINTCMSVVERQQADAWAPVLSSDKHLMFADMNQLELIRLTVEVIRGDLTNFMKGMADAVNSNGDSPTVHP